MKQRLWLLSVAFALQGRELVLIPYAYRSGHAYFLLTATPYKTAETIKDTIQDDDDRIESGATIFSKQTNALWGKYVPGNLNLLKQSPTRHAFEKSLDSITVRLERAVDQESYVNTALQDIYFFELPYVDVKNMPLLDSSQDAWYEHNKLVWVPGSDLFEKKIVKIGKTTRQQFKVKKTQINDLRLDDSTIRQLNLLGVYTPKQLNEVLHPSKGVFDRFVRRRAVPARRLRRSSVHSARLRRSRG